MSVSLIPMKNFLNSQYSIPNYQREYSWEEDELTDFWQDLQETKNNASQNHFFGQIVVQKEDNTEKKNIIDGQQRTITSLIFLWVCRSKLLELYEASNHNPDILRRIYSVESFCLTGGDGKPYIPSLKLGNEEDDKYFRTYVINSSAQPEIKPLKKSCQRLFNAYNKFVDFIHEECSELSANDQYNCISKYIKTFLDNFQVMYMETSKLEDAFVIFETLNARGKELETADLLKNFIFSKSSDVKAAEEKWNMMTSNLCTSSKSIDTTKYIRHYWNSRHTCTREKDLYRAISKEIKTTRASNSLLTSLCKFAAYYHDMVFPEDANKIENEELLNSLKSLRILKAKTFYTVILAMLEMNYKEKEIAVVANAIENYVFRNSTIMRQTANRTEVFFSTIAYEIIKDNNLSINCECQPKSEPLAHEFLSHSCS